MSGGKFGNSKFEDAEALEKWKECEKLKKELKELKSEFKVFKEYVFYTLRNSNIEVKNPLKKRFSREIE